MKIIYGTSGTGKSEYIFNEIKKSNEKKSYIITPDQFSFTTERKLIDYLDEGATLKCEVLSFERMAYKVIKECISDNLKTIGRSGKAEIIYDEIVKNQKKLKFLGKSQENIDTIITQIVEFKKHNITVETLEKQKENTEDEYLKAKLNDMLIMYKALESKIDNIFVDENDLLNILAENLKISHLFDGAVFYIDEFSGFTKQEYQVINELNKIAKEIYITVCTDDLRITKSPEADIFYDNKQTVDSLCQMFDLDKEKQIKLSQNHRFKNKELEHLEENFFTVPYKVYNEDPKNIKLYLAENKYSEIEHIATNIVKLVRDEGYRYNEIAVITKEIEEYSSLCKAIFAEYEIPVFIDTKKDITQNVIIKYVLSIFDIFTKNWSYEAVFNYLKTGIIEIDNIYEFENYCLKWGIRGKKWYEEKWNYEIEENAENFNDLQEKITVPLLKLKDKIKENKTAKQISLEVYKFLKEQLTGFIKEEKDVEAWKIVCEVLQEISEIFEDEKFSFDDYSKILKTGLASKELGQIPQTIDKVTVGDVNRSRTHKVKAVFIIGVNDGVFPSSATAEGFFNDLDRERLKEQGFELAKGSKEKLYEENFNIYKAFTTAEEKLFVSYVSSDFDGNALRKSLLISKLKRMFKNLKEETEDVDEILTKDVTFSKLLDNLNNDDWNEVFDWYKQNEPEKLKSAIAGFYYSNEPENLNKEMVEKLYGDVLKTSISRMETYRTCSFSYFLKYGLQLSDKEKLDIKPIDTGSFMHEIIDRFFKSAKDIKTISEEEIKEILDEIIDEELLQNKKFGLTAKYRTLVQRLKRVIFLSIKYIVQNLKNSKFDVLGTEINFGNDYPPIEIKLDDGKKVLITGKIDRVDIAQMPDGKYIRIIDYKSSYKDIDLNQVVAGLQLQLITYVDAIQKNNEDFKTAGALYFSLVEPKLIGNKRGSKTINLKQLEKEDIEKIIRENYRMNGLILADANIINSMDYNIEKGESYALPITLDKNGKIDFEKSSTVTREEFEKLQKYTNKIIKQISSEILSGKVELKPYYNIKEKSTPCRYCAYKSICGFNPKFKGNNYKNIINKPQKDVLKEIVSSASEE